MYFIFPPHLTSASALPGETENPEIACFLLKCCMLFHQKTRNKKYHLVRAEPYFTVKAIDWVHDTGPRKEHSILLSVTHMLRVSRVCHSVSRCVKAGVVLRQPRVKVNGQY